MRSSSEDVCSALKELAEQQARNRDWNKELRRRIKALVQSRLAGDITQEDYLVFRHLTNEDSLECRRRAAQLQDQILHMSDTANPLSQVVRAR